MSIRGKVALVTGAGQGIGRAIPLRLARDGAHIAIVNITDFENMTVFKPHLRHAVSVKKMLDQLVAWAGALQSLRKTQRQLKSG